MTQIRPVLTPQQQKLLDDRSGSPRGGLKGPNSQQQQAEQEEGDQ